MHTTYCRLLYCQTSCGSNQKFEYLRSKRAMKSDSTIPKQFDWQESTELAISNKRKALPYRLFVKNPFYNVKTRRMLIICEVHYFLLSISCFLGFNKTPFQNYILCFVSLSQDMFTYIKNARKEYIERKILESYSLSNDHITSLPAKLWSHTENHFPSFFFAFNLRYL